MVALDFIVKQSNCHTTQSTILKTPIHRTIFFRELLPLVKIIQMPAEAGKMPRGIAIRLPFFLSGD
jgi:hypothetical protein